MNVERLHAIALAVKADIDATQSVQLLEQLAAHLQNVVNQPQQPSHQEQVSKIRTTIINNLQKSKTNSFSPAWKQTVSELGIDMYIGNQLAEKIKLIFMENQITPQVALTEIQKLQNTVTQLQASLQEMISGFNHFNLGHEVLEPGEGEIGILLPREYLHNRFDKLAKEFKELNGILSVLSEVGTGTSEHFEIRSLSTTDPFITLGMCLGALSTVALAIKPIISAYKEILEVRLLHAQLAEKNISEKRLKGIEEHAEEIMEKAIDEIKAELLERYPGTDKGRKNELSNALGPALKKLANRVDRGFNVEIRVEPIADDEEDEQENKSAEDVQIILDAMDGLEFMKLEGEPILHLPESSDEDQ